MGTETKICTHCGVEKPIESFQINKLKGQNPYRISVCQQCRYRIRKERKNSLSENIDVKIPRQFKKIVPEKVLDVTCYGIDLIGEDEVFMEKADCINFWISNYGRAVQKTEDGYSLKKKHCDKNGSLFYYVKKERYKNGRWEIYKTSITAAKAVIEVFVVNPEVKNNNYYWHKGFDKEDNYYKNLYPLNKEQYRIVKAHFMNTGKDSEEFIIKVMNDIKFKPYDWRGEYLEPIMCGVGYPGTKRDFKSVSYRKWSDMIHRSYNIKFHIRNPQYKDCEVCEEWKNYSNFKEWYEKHFYGDTVLDLDKDILYKGNKLYSPETCCLVPHIINTVFVNNKKDRGKYPVGIYFDKDKNKFRAECNILGTQVKLGYFSTVEEAFQKYKKYKEDVIRDTAEKYKGTIPYKVYEAMLRWEVEITD